MRVAIIDLGTNTFNLLVCGWENEFSVIHSEEVAVFLGRGGMEHRMLTNDAMDRGINALRSIVEKARELGAERIDAFGTSALRNARNAHVFVARVKDEFKIDVRIINGEEEATLILEGVRKAVTFTAKPMLVMDIGGGSVEFILATNKALMWKRSFEIGVTRLLERFSPSDPITIEEHFRIASYLDTQLEPLFAMMDRHWPSVLVGSAGVFSTLATITGNIRGFSGATPSSTISNDEYLTIREALLSLSSAERHKLFSVPIYQASFIPMVFVLIDAILARQYMTLICCGYALREGLVVRMLIDPSSTVHPSKHH